jgi:hyperosmotically inducible protein
MKFFIAVMLAALMSTAANSFAQAAPDNTKTNKRDRNAGEATADQQKNDKTDLDLTAQIRRSITKDKALSTNAHNVKIIAQNGMVTLKGPVKSESSKSNPD